MGLSTAVIPNFYDICLQLNSGNAANRKLIYENNPALAVRDAGLPVGTKASNNASIRSLTLQAYTELGEMTLPNFADTDNEFSRNQKTLAAQWSSPHYKLVFWKRARGGLWLRRGSMPINSVKGYDDMTVNVFDFVSDDVFEGVGHGGSLACSFEDSGWGVPRNTDDIRLFGSVVHELHCWEDYKLPIAANFITNTTVGTGTVIVAEERLSRASFILVVTAGTGTVSIKLGTGATATNRDFALTGAGQSTPLNTSYNGVITASATAAGHRVQVIETVR